MKTTSTTISEVEQIIIERLQENYPKVYVGKFSSGSFIDAPSILLETLEGSAHKPDMKGRMGISYRFHLHCILGSQLGIELLDKELKEMSASVTYFIWDRANSFWVKDAVCEPEDIESYPGNFSDDTKGGYDSRIVSWLQKIYLSESIWNTDDLPPQKVFIAHSPDSDSPDDNQYEEIS